MIRIDLVGIELKSKMKFYSLKLRQKLTKSLFPFIDY